MAEVFKIPIRLGVTGHRSFQEGVEGTLREGVRAVFEWFERAYPGTPLLLLSSLAEGADQLCAEVALEKGHRVTAPLPFPRSVYLGSTSFSTDEGLRRVGELLDSPRVESFVAPRPGAKLPTDEDEAGWALLRGDPGSRQDRYADAGVYVAQHCQALIALWDGEVSEQQGGTYQILRLKLTGEFSDPSDRPGPTFQWADRGPVFVVHSPRGPGGADPSVPAREAGEVRELYPGDDPARRDPGLVWPGGRRPPVRWWSALLGLEAPNPRRSTFDEGCLRLAEFNREPSGSGSGASALEQVKSKASALAKTCHNQIDWYSLAAFVLMFVALLCFHGYAHLEQDDLPGWLHRGVLLWLYLFFLLAVFAVAYWVGLRHLERKWLDFRALAEALRVQDAWCRSGVDASVAANYLQQVHSELSWVRHAARACGPPYHVCRDEFAAKSPDRQLETLRSVCDDWVGGQRRFFEKYEHYHHLNERLHWLGYGLAIAGAVLAFWMALGDANEPKHFMLIASGSLVVAGGLVIGFKARQLFSELARQYERMFVLFSDGERDLRRHLNGGDVAEAQQLLVDLGREALSDNAGWLTLHRARPFEPPFG
jgi:hypothetical protein